MSYMARQFPVGLVGGYRPVVTSGLIFNLDLGDVACYPGSGQTIFDLTANDNDWFRGPSSGVDLGDPTYVAGPPAYLRGDGGDYIVLAAAHAGAAIRQMTRRDHGFSLEAWVYFASLPSDNHALLIDSFASSEQGGYFYFNTAAKMIARSTLPDAVAGIATTAVTTGAWMQLGYSGRWEGSTTCRFIRNGASDGTHTHTTNWTTGDSARVPSSMVRATDGALIFANGSRLAILRAYSRALSVAEFAQNFAAKRHYFGI